MSDSTLMLRRGDVARSLTFDACFAAVEAAFRDLGRGGVPPPASVGVYASEGGFHIKASLLRHGNRTYFAAKCNANFTHNPVRRGLPAIQGLIVLCDGESGSPLAVLDSIEITILRTAAATALAAKHLARPDAAVVTICGCGNQGTAHLRALSRVLHIRRALAVDPDASAAARFASDLSRELDISIESVRDVGCAVGQSDVCVTCTPSRTPIVAAEHVRPGTFLAAVGADSPDKQELDHWLLIKGKLVVDSLEQCAVMGELHHALEAGLMARADVYAELGAIVAGCVPGRIRAEEITIFDSTGIATADVAAAVAVFERTKQDEGVLAVDFGEVRL
jgi:ornithine cyclodeaminase/alanine dehydrogenase-like protein (mu-crystallin family)